MQRGPTDRAEGAAAKPGSHATPEPGSEDRYPPYLGGYPLETCAYFCFALGMHLLYHLALLSIALVPAVAVSSPYSNYSASLEGQSCTDHCASLGRVCAQSRVQM